LRRERLMIARFFSCSVSSSTSLFSPVTASEPTCASVCVCVCVCVCINQCQYVSNLSKRMRRGVERESERARARARARREGERGGGDLNTAALFHAHYLPPQLRSNNAAVSSSKAQVQQQSLVGEPKHHSTCKGNIECASCYLRPLLHACA
jgi:hypothetical protein